MSLRNALLALILMSIFLTLFPTSFAHAAENAADLTQNFVDVMQRVLISIDSVTQLIQTAIVHIARSVYSLMATSGFLTWISRYDRHLGRDLIFGSLMLAFFVECALPIFSF
jgi:hypothetical protein